MTRPQLVILVFWKLTSLFPRITTGPDYVLLSVTTSTAALNVSNSRLIADPPNPLSCPCPRAAAASQHLFAHMSIDFLTDLPPAETSHDSILVLVDHSLSKGVILIPCKKENLRTLYH